MSDSTPAYGIPVRTASLEPGAAPQVRDQRLWEGRSGRHCEMSEQPAGLARLPRSVAGLWLHGLRVPSPDPRWPQSGFCEPSPPRFNESRSRRGSEPGDRRSQQGIVAAMAAAGPALGRGAQRGQCPALAGDTFRASGPAARGPQGPHLGTVITPGRPALDAGAAPTRPGCATNELCLRHRAKNGTLESAGLIQPPIPKYSNTSQLLRRLKEFLVSF